MPRYSSGAQVVADARLRLRGLRRDDPAVAMAVAEGRDDLLVLASAGVPLQQIVPAGNKANVVDAYERLSDAERNAVICIVDCDFDPPAERLAGRPGLVITDGADLEADLMALGLLKPALLRFVHAARASGDELERVHREIIEASASIAEQVGRLRAFSRASGLDLRFADLDLAKFRRDGEVDIGQLVRVVLQRTEGRSAAEASDVLAQLEAYPARRKNCSGKDLIEATRVVLRDDYGVRRQDTAGLDQLVITAAGGTSLAGWPVLRRIDRWADERGLRLRQQ